ncbi:efflux RND transporter periplasmic adaptor subunit [Asinibacterium sp. OR53]|uniref:efflux RND transporter periplasmic adaptor subunit n=1 Tax=Asinibacterium sp. OR53 TaxID=925409 RepID=UPI0004B27FF0|nr:efflux RND transporter periplasmic adaptor subunit [Asinibacterium sp. OR53]
MPRRYYWIIFLVLAGFEACKDRWVTGSGPQAAEWDSMSQSMPGMVKAPDTMRREVYTCSMHPQVIRDTPGQCPICRMELLKKSAESRRVDGIDLGTLLKPTNGFVIASLPVITMEWGSVAIEVKALGFVTYDTRRVGAISARVSGRIEKLYVRYRFEPVHAGQKIMDMYSPELLTAQQNLLFLLKNDAANATLIAAARERLLLLGMSPGQLAEVVRTGKAAYTVSICSGYSGHVHEAGGMMNVRSGVAGAGTTGMGGPGGMPDISLITEELALKEGMYVQKGQTVLKVYDPSRVWALVNIYAGQQGLVRKGDSVTLRAEVAPDQVIWGKIDFIEPSFRRDQKTLTARVYFDNARLRLPVGSQVEATIRSAPVSGNWLPKEAVVSLGLDKVAFVRTRGGFVAHRVETGYVYDGKIQVLGGLAPADSVARDGQYLMDSESFIIVK